MGAGLRHGNENLQSVPNSSTFQELKRVGFSCYLWIPQVTQASDVTLDLDGILYSYQEKGD